MVKIPYPKQYDDDFLNIVKELIRLFNSMGYKYDLSLQMALEILAQNKDVQQQIDNIIRPIADPNSEVAQARGVHDLLYQRLDSYNKRFEQTDYVEQFKKYNSFGNIQIFKLNDYMFEISVWNNDRHITYAFQTIADDDFIIQTRIWVGGFKKVVAELRGVMRDEMTFTGNFTNPPTSSAAMFAQNIGDTFEYTLDTNDNEAFQMRFFKDDRGGLWRIYLDGAFVKDVSTFSSVSGYGVEYIGELSAGNHTIKGEFIGDDVNNPPRDGTSRGWLSSMSDRFIIIGNSAIEPSKDLLIVEPSNKEFAFNIMPENGTTHEFVPFHGVKTSFEASPMIIRDGDTVVDFKSYPNNTTILLEKFSFKQHIYGRHPESGSENLLEIHHTTLIDKHTGMMSFDGKMEVLYPVIFNNSYVIMGTATGALFDRVVTSFGNQYIGDSSNYGENIPMEEERDWAKSYAFISSKNKDLGIAFRFNNIRETLRQGDFGKDTTGDTMTYLNNRNEAIKKIYSRLFNSQLVMPGYTMRYSGDYIYVDSNDIYDLYHL